MTFVHPLLLGGLALVGLPILLHLIFQQKPKRLPFPALRFLQQRKRTNQRKLQLRHWLLLALRMLLLAAFAVALARPKLFSDRINLGGDQPVDLVFIVDTSVSMEYTVAGKTRLDEAKTRALELLDEFPPSSRVAVIDSAEALADWQPSATAARERLQKLTLSPANAPVTSSLPAAYKLLGSRATDGDGRDAVPAIVAVVSDRTPACWDADRLTDLTKLRDVIPRKPLGVFLDVGVEKPLDAAVVDVQLQPQAVPANRPVVLHANVRATGQGLDSELLIRVDDGATERRAVKVSAGQSVTYTVERRDLAAGFHHASIGLATADNLPGNNSRSTSFEVRPARRVLLLAESQAGASSLYNAWRNLYAVEVKLASDPAVRGLGRDELAVYHAVVLDGVAAPPADLWERLEEFVARGGGLAVVPGGEEMVRADYGTPGTAARRLLGGAVGKLVTAEPPGARWTGEQFAHPVLAPFAQYAQIPNIDFVRRPPTTRRYWEFTPDEGRTAVLARYSDDAGRPALLETRFDPARIKGKAFVLTTPFDGRADASGEPWNSYLQSSFAVVLPGLLMRYLAGDSSDATFNFTAGQVPLVTLPQSARFPAYTLTGPGLTASEATVSRADGADELRLPQARMPGAYRLTGGPAGWEARFSVNVPVDESLLTPRIALSTPGVEGSIERLFGADSVYPLGRAVAVKDALGQQLRQPVELFPLLMVFVLLALVIENWLANRFYKTEAAVPARVAA